MEPRKILLEEKEMPTSYYNIQADLPHPLDPPLHPGTGKPIGPYSTLRQYFRWN